MYNNQGRQKKNKNSNSCLLPFRFNYRMIDKIIPSEDQNCAKGKIRIFSANLRVSRFPSKPTSFQ